MKCGPSHQDVWPFHTWQSLPQHEPYSLGWCFLKVLDFLRIPCSDASLTVLSKLLLNITSSIFGSWFGSGVTRLLGTLVGNYLLFLLLLWMEKLTEPGFNTLLKNEKICDFHRIVNILIVLSLFLGQASDMFLRLDQVSNMSLFHRIYLKRNCIVFMNLPFEILNFRVRFRKPSFDQGTDMNKSWSLSWEQIPWRPECAWTPSTQHPASSSLCNVLISLLDHHNVNPLKL
jgi:hypothetical protein